MFMIDITVNSEMSAEQHASLFPQHVEWFKKYFSAGQFVLIGPYTDGERSGVILARTQSRDELMTILREDVYYPDLAHYEIRPFSPRLIADNLPQLQEE